MVALVVDLKAALDSVDRGILIRIMRKRGIRKGLIKRVTKVLTETRSTVKVGEEKGNSFWTAKGVR